ncbi:MAG TPA: Gfo/Idh/MocA family oxidoreductase [Armatimonadota bacterium]|jgi:predicted dehydrogenase
MADYPVGFGLLGAGLVAPFHAQALTNSPKTRLVGVADMNLERATKLAGEFGAPAYGSLEEMLANPEVQCVNVLTPNAFHYDAVVAAAQAGRHVLVEKPPAMSLRETDSMIATCQEHGVKLGIVLQCRLRKPIQAMKQALAAGRFGRVLMCSAHMKWFRSADYYQSEAWRSSRKSGAGVTIQHAFHYLDLCQYLMGPAQRVQARMENLAHPEVQLEDTLLAYVDWSNGALGVAEASTALWPGADIRIELNGENGTAIMVGERMDTWKFREELPEDEEVRTYGSAAVGTAATGPADFAYFDHRLVIEDMAGAIVENREPCIPATSVRPTLEMALAMYQSARDGQPVDLPLASEEHIFD